MRVFGCVKDLFKGLDVRQKKPGVIFRIVSSCVPSTTKTGKEYEQDYKRFRSFLRDNCQLVKGEYCNFDDIYASYVNWEAGDDPSKQLTKSAVGHYLKRSSKLKRVTSSKPGVKAGWNSLYLDITLKNKRSSSIKPQYGELYRYTNLYLYETGSLYDFVFLGDIFIHYCEWCKKEGTTPYSYSLFSNRLRKFLDKKKVRFEVVKVDGKNFRFLVGAGVFCRA